MRGNYESIQTKDPCNMSWRPDKALAWIWLP